MVLVVLLLLPPMVACGHGSHGGKGWCRERETSVLFMRREGACNADREVSAKK